MRYLLLLFLVFTQSLIYSNVVIINGLTHVHQSKSGALISGVIQLRNTSETEQRIVFYLNDMVQECGKETVLTPKIINSRSLFNWFTTSVNERVLAPKEDFELLYTINVPNEDNLLGSYWGVLMVEIEKPIKEDQLEHGLKLESKVRYGIQIITDINTFKIPELEFNNIEFKDEANEKLILVDVQNNGVFVAQPDLYIELFNKEGVRIKRDEVRLKKVYPNSCKLFSFDVTDIPPGSYTATIAADNNQNILVIDVEFEKK